uniref:C2H2-type domain-containing protein n=1 Tax=Ditylenchus dipsaci TaxID=166011 RepID=A0A915D087_9BILA
MRQSHDAGHIAAHLAYFPHYCVDCKFKSSDVHSLVEHEFSTGHSTRQNESNRYLEKVCSNIYKDCLIATKDGYEAVFVPITGGKNQAAVTQNTPASVSKKAVPSRKDTSESDSESDDDVKLLPQPKCSISKKNAVQEKKQISSVSFGKNAEITQNKVVAQADSSNISSSGPSRSAEDENFMTVAELDRQINRGHLTQKCNQCKQDITNNYKSQKEHVLRDHRSKQINEDKDTVNDYQCGICGCEVKGGSRKTHINKEHLFCYLECPVKDCIYNNLCESAITTHIKNAHKISAQELKNDEKKAFVDGRSEYNAKMKLYLSRCFPCPVSSKGSDKQEKEALAEFQREMNNRPAIEDASLEIISPRHDVNTADKPTVDYTKRSEDGKRASFESADHTTVHRGTLEGTKHHDNPVASNLSKNRASPHENFHAKTSTFVSHTNEQPDANLSRTPQSSFSDRTKTGQTSSGQDQRSSYNRGFRGEISPKRTGSKRISPSVVSMESPQSHHFVSAKVHSKFGGGQRQFGNKDHRARASPPKKVRSRSSNREPVCTPSNRYSSGWSSVQRNQRQQFSSFSSGFDNTGFFVAGQAPTNAAYGIPQPSLSNQSSRVTYGSMPMPTNNFGTKNYYQGGTYESTIKKENN